MQPTRTKIVATVGPACSSPEAVARLIAAGVDVFRLNFSHGTHETHGRAIETIREAADRADQPVAVMQDLQGPRIRTGALREHASVELTAGQEVVLKPGDFEGDAHAISVTYDGLARDVRPGDPVLLCDGLIELQVLEADGAQARCKVVVGGTLGEHKGINLPGVRLGISAPTEKDLEDLRFGLAKGVDYVALSFVESGDDVARLKEEMAASGSAEVPVIAKIERPRAVENLDGILDVAAGVMVARGDLGLE
jgi:pyruvate kinase